MKTRSMAIQATLIALPRPGDEVVSPAGYRWRTVKTTGSSALFAAVDPRGALGEPIRITKADLAALLGAGYRVVAATEVEAKS